LQFDKKIDLVGIKISSFGNIPQENIRYSSSSHVDSKYPPLMILTTSRPAVRARR
jgi:hypothetical protein